VTFVDDQRPGPEVDADADADAAVTEEDGLPPAIQPGHAPGAAGEQELHEPPLAEENRTGIWPWPQLPGWAGALLLVACVGVVAAITRFARLSTDPPGFLIDEAASALFAQSINRDNLPIFFGGGTPDVQEPFFFYVMKWTGTVFGWDVSGARTAAALCGVAAAVACALWYRRALGPLWGLAGGLLVATSFWQLMFSRQAIRPISMPVFAALGLWCLWEALHTPSGAPRPHRLGWYAAAGAAWGLGFYTYISFRLALPAVVVLGVVLWFWGGRVSRAAALPPPPPLPILGGGGARSEERRGGEEWQCGG
jgi:hypothetical protein